MGSFSLSYKQYSVYEAREHNYAWYGNTDAPIVECYGGFHTMSWYEHDLEWTMEEDGDTRTYSKHVNTIPGLTSLYEYLNIDSVRAATGLTSQTVQEIHNILSAHTIYSGGSDIGQWAPFITLTEYEDTQYYNVVGSGISTPANAPYGTPMNNPYNLSNPSKFAGYMNRKHITNLSNANTFWAFFNLLQVGIDDELFTVSDDLQRVIDNNITYIKEDKSGHFDVYLNSFRSNVLGGYELSSVVVRWENNLVKQSLTEENWDYQPNNTVIKIGVTDGLKRTDIKNLSEVLYGELQYKVTAEQIFNTKGTNKAIETISALIPALNVGDAYLTLQLRLPDTLLDTNDICVAQIPMNSTTQDASHLKTLQGKKGSTVTIHYATDSDPIPDVDPTENPGWGFPDLPIDDTFTTDPGDDTDVTITPGTNSNIGLLTKSYAMTESNLQAMGNILWSDGFMDNIQLVNNSPIENIISVKAFPFNISGGNSKTIRLGNVTMTGVTGNEISHSFNPIKEIGTFTVPKKFNDGLHNYLDYAPYTNVTIYLPYIGFKDISSTINDYMGKQIKVRYIYDIITGVCTACLYYKNSAGSFIEFEKYSGNIGIDIPVSASNRAQVQASYLQNGLNAVATMLTGGILSGVMGALNAGLNMMQTPYHKQTSGSPSPSCDGFDEQGCYIIINRPVYKEPSTFGHEFGYPCNLTRNLAGLSGYTRCHDVDVKDVYCTENERAQIKSLLESGVNI